MAEIENRRIEARPQQTAGPITLTLNPSQSKWLQWASRTFGRAEIDIVTALLVGCDHRLSFAVTSPTDLAEYQERFANAYNHRMEMEAAR